MATRTKIIKVFSHERALLVDMYLRRRVPIDQFEHRADELDELTSEWNELTGRSNTPGEVIHYMRNERKCGRWPKLDGKYQKTPPKPFFSADEGEALVAIYRVNVADKGIGSDAIATDEAIGELIASEFVKITGRAIPAAPLMAKLTALRKRGQLNKVAVIPAEESVTLKVVRKQVV
jgi:hypothetical protein